MSNPIGATNTLATYQRPLGNCLFAAVCIIALWLRLTNSPVAVRSPDEKYYTYYAEQVAHAPLGAPSALVDKYNASPKSWTYPIPLRVAHYYSIAAIMALFRLPAEQAGAALSTACSILQFAFAALAGMRLFGRWPTLCALAMLAVSPEDLVMARRDWGDGVSGCVAMLMIWLCIEIIHRPRPRSWYLAFWITGAYLVLVKETGGVFFALCVLGLAIHCWLAEHSWQRIARILLCAILTGVCAFAIMTTLCGGVSAALETTRHSAQAAPTNIFGITYQSGPWYSIPQALFLLSPVSAICCLVAMLILAIPSKDYSADKILALENRNRQIAIAIAALIILIIAAITIPPALKNLRYISFILAPIYLLAGLAFAYISTILTRATGPRFATLIPPLAAFVLIASCTLDYLQFRQVFIQSNVKDLDIRQIIDFPLPRYSR